MSAAAGGWPPTELPRRLGRLREVCTSLDLGGLLVTSLVNVRYLTGFTGSAALLLVLPDDALFVSDGRYTDQAREELGSGGVDVRIEITGTGQRELLQGAVSGLARLGLEAPHVSWDQARRYGEEWFPTVELVPTSGLVEDLRRVKDEGEIARLLAAAAIADDALASVAGRLSDGPTEREFGLELDHAMRLAGAEDLSFETIVAGGPNGAKPHARPGDRAVREGDLVVVDFGAVLDGYHSDMTRTFALGDLAPTQERQLAVVLEAQAAGVRAVGPGVAYREVDRACRSVIEAAGWGTAFSHSTGHGVGLEVHEAPRVATTAEGQLAVGEVVTVEPGVYLSGSSGVRIEDTLVVTDSGSRPLTGFGKEHLRL